MKLEWMVMAEGLGSDASGALTLIGVNRNVLVAAALPAITKRAVLVHVTGAPTDIPSDVQVNFSVLSPSRKVLVAQNASLKLAPARWANMPAFFDIPAEFELTIREYGDHTIRAEIELNDESLSSEISLHVQSGPPATGG
jgi:hypothetical protein